MGRVGYIVAALPPLFLLAKLGQYSYVFPYWDHFNLLVPIEKALEGRFEFVDIWRTYNQHRILFPRLWMLALAIVSGWDIRLELASNVLFASTSFACLIELTRRTSASGGRKFPIPALVAYSFFVYSWTQMENWIWGWQIQIFMVQAAGFVMIVALSTPKPLWLGFSIGMCAAILGTFSFASGLLLWPAGLVFIVWCGDARSRWSQGSIWVATAVGCVVAYFTGFEAGPEPPPGFAPIAVAQFTVLFIGSPITNIFATPAWHGVAFEPGAAHYMAGIVGILLALRLSAEAFRTASIRQLLPFVTLMLLAVASGVAIGAGRWDLGPSQGLTSRYTTLSAPFWCGLVGMGHTVWLHRDPDEHTKLLGRVVHIGSALAVVLALLSLWTVNQFYEQTAEWKTRAWNGLRLGIESPVFAHQLVLHSDAMLESYVPRMRKHHLAGMDDTSDLLPEDALPYIESARDFARDGLIDAADANLRAALAIDPDNEEANRIADWLKEARHP